MSHAKTSTIVAVANACGTGIAGGKGVRTRAVTTEGGLSSVEDDLEQEEEEEEEIADG